MSRAPATVALVALALVAGAAAAGLGIRSGPLSVFTYPFELRVDTIPVSVRIEPESLQRKSGGDHVTAFVTVPDGLSGAAIDQASLRLCAGTAPCASGVAADRSQVVAGGRTLKADFDRGRVIALVAGVETPATVFFTVTGLVSAPPLRFAGSDELKLLGP